MVLSAVGFLAFIQQEEPKPYCFLRAELCRTAAHRGCLHPRKPGQLVQRCASVWDREEQPWLPSPEHLGHTLPSSHYNVVVVNEFSVLKTKVIFIPGRNFGVTYTATLLLRSCVSSALKMSTVSFGRWGGPVLSVPLICLCGGGVGWHGGGGWDILVGGYFLSIPSMLGLE